MKKYFTMLLSVVMCISLCACNIDTSGKENASAGQGTMADGTKDTEAKGAGTDADGNSTGETGQNERTGSGGSLLKLCDEGLVNKCYTDAGYYYLTEESEQLNEKDYGMHLMYMDFATRQEVYLCSDTGCEHNTADCTSVFLFDDFPSVSSRIFIYQNKLYVLSKEYDNDGSISTNMMIGEEGSFQSDTKPVTLYQMNLDGTNREKFYTFEPDVMVEDVVLGGSKGIYVITKKLSTETLDGSNQLTTSSERRLTFLDMTTKSASMVCSMDFDDNIDWDIAGCSGNSLILRGTDFGKELTADDILDDDAYKALYVTSSDVIADLNIATGDIHEIYRISNKTGHAMEVSGGMLYISDADTGEIRSKDLGTGDEKVLCNLKQNYIYYDFEDTLCCCDWDMVSDNTFYFVDKKTGEVSHSTLVNKRLGWKLEFEADLGSQVLVIYDYEAVAHADDSYEITRYQYGLISKEDLYAGTDKFTPIKMIGKGI